MGGPKYPKNDGHDDSVLTPETTDRTCQGGELGGRGATPSQHGLDKSQPRGAGARRAGRDHNRARGACLSGTVPTGVRISCSLRVKSCPTSRLGPPWARAPAWSPHPPRPAAPAARTHRSRHWASLLPGTSSRILNQSCSPYLATACSNFCRKDRQMGLCSNHNPPLSPLRGGQCPGALPRRWPSRPPHLPCLPLGSRGPF